MAHSERTYVELRCNRELTHLEIEVNKVLGQLAEDGYNVRDVRTQATACEDALLFLATIFYEK